MNKAHANAEDYCHRFRPGLLSSSMGMLKTIVAETNVVEYGGVSALSSMRVLS